MLNNHPSFEYENIMQSNGFRRIAGVDEAGRGCIAGPIVAGAVILPENTQQDWLLALNDSKKLSEKQREELYSQIIVQCDYGIGIIDSEDIDRYGMAQCGQDVLVKALMDIDPPADCALVDYFKLPTLTIPQMNITKGDAISLTIAAASIVAKVTRDHLMYEYDKQYPLYQFGKHKGYGTSLHSDIIRKKGLCPIHRVSFCQNILHS